MKFSLATLVSLPLFVASLHAAIVYPLAIALVYGIVLALLFAYALTCPKNGNQLDVRAKPGLVFLIGCVVICAGLLIGIQTLQILSPSFKAWAFEYHMTNRGYHKAWHDPVIDSNGQVLSRGFTWKP